MPRSDNNNGRTTTEFTLIFVKSNENVLLGFKKRGFGAGKWNGFGGKVEKDETILEGAIRELKEESNLTVSKANMIYLGYVRYDRVDSPQIDIVYIFTASEFSGSLAESEEMAPKWFKIGEIPYEKMWVDSKHWLPIVLRNRGIFAKFLLSGERNIVQMVVEERDEHNIPEFVQ
ncbi:putative GTP diphosphatase [Trypoxylus dichotomus]